MVYNLVFDYNIEILEQLLQANHHLKYSLVSLLHVDIYQLLIKREEAIYKMAKNPYHKQRNGLS